MVNMSRTRANEMRKQMEEEQKLLISVLESFGLNAFKSQNDLKQASNA
jgi:hypothetical protein